jgi:hypothetical protein
MMRLHKGLRVRFDPAFTVAGAAEYYVKAARR